ncbi:CHAT domain-containing protein [Leptolyngbya sp. Heron Island J]|uniref:CHAT domain-containing protein n=1 Tax=Leptolyngbya sp. Heron Island J TaxID=1385935 RepID=UPI000404EEA7|nr:CHAT domain-containing protein [Leptolyngbya sp. Heron Island J]
MFLGTGRVTAQLPEVTEPTVVISCAIPSQVSLSQAQKLYESGCYDAAAKVLNRIIQQQNNSLTQAIALSNLSLTYQQLGNWDDATTAIDTAFELIPAVTSGKRTTLQAQALDVRGQLQLARGESSAAASSWQQAAQLYTQLGETNRAALSQLKQAQALQTIGLFQQVQVILLDVEKSLRNQPDSDVKATVLRQLADILWTTGKVNITLINSAENDQRPTTQALCDKVQYLFNQSEFIGEALNRTDLTAAVALSKGNCYRYQFLGEISKSKIDHTAAYRYLSDSLNAYQQVTTNSGHSLLAVQARLNQFNLQVDPDFRGWFADAPVTANEQRQQLERKNLPVILQSLYRRIKEQLNSLPLGRQAVYARVNLAQSLMNWKQIRTSAVDWSEVQLLLDEAEDQARQLDDQRSLSYVLGHQAKLYELAGQTTMARELTRQALNQAQSIRAQDISYQWQYQLGHLLKEHGNREAAIAAYTEAFETLQKLRTDLIIANADQRFYFRDNIEPIYRELIALLLAPSSESKGSNIAEQVSQKELNLVRQVMDSLQVAELENFFQAACVDTKTELGETLQPGNAGIYPIVLEDRLEILLQLPADNSINPQKAEAQPILRRFSSPVAKHTIEDTVKRVQIPLDAYARGAIGRLRTNSRELYDDLFLAKEVGSQLENAPTLAEALETAMQGTQNPTLIFVLDGPLQAIPMGVLYDGQQYLLEKYAIALNLGIEVRESDPLPKGADLRVLAAGIANPPNWPALPNVTDELATIDNSKASAKLLQEEEFTQSKFNQQLNNANYQIVHLATHGTFSSNREQTFIVAQDGKIPIDQLSEWFRNTQAIQNPIELIIFSACRTATGDDRAVLGLAGATVQSGARSAIATLWSVDDKASVTFARSFYQHLEQPHTSRAVALQQAQRDMKRIYKSRNKFWAPYVLIGSWR